MRVLKTVGMAGLLGVMSFGGAVPARAQTQLDQQAKAGVNVQSGAYGGINQTPWFSNPTIRQQLQLNDDQFNQLNKGYTQSWSRYNQGLTGLDKTLADEQRIQRNQDLTGAFYKDFSKSTDGVFTDKTARQRYNQLDLQYRGYGAFSDPAIQQQLNLTDEQRQKFNKYHNEWNHQMHAWQRDFANDRDGVTSKFSDARKEWQNRINSTLTPEQRTMWNDMRGKPFDFPADVYFQNGTTTNTTLKPVVK